jgi:quinol-cytochrome oxidoreductase complex cytochrome b subunit
MERFLTLHYYFVPVPDPAFQFTKLTLAVGLILLIGGFVFSYYLKNKLQDKITKKLLKKCPGRLKIYGLILLFLLICREQGIPYLSMRIWWFILIAVILYNGITMALNYKEDYEKRAKKLKNNSAKKKYLPKKKK